MRCGTTFSLSTVRDCLCLVSNIGILDSEEVRVCDGSHILRERPSISTKKRTRQEFPHQHDINHGSRLYQSEHNEIFFLFDFYVMDITDHN
jgi:hypothetical protein